MTPANTDELADGLSVLFAALPTSVSGDPELKTRAYLLALRNVSGAALREAVAQVLDGSASVNSRVFVPTPPELAVLCRSIEAQGRRELERLKRDEMRSRGEIGFTPSPKTRARIADGFKQLSAAITVEKPTGPQAKPPQEGRAA